MQERRGIGPVVGRLRRDKRIVAVERHLGAITENADNGGEPVVQRFAIFTMGPELTPEMTMAGSRWLWKK